MIPVASGCIASIPRPAPRGPCWLLLALAGCVAPAEPTVARLAREQQEGTVFAERDRRRRELQLARQETQDLMAGIAAAQAASVRSAAELRAVRAALAFELERLHAAESDLEAARTRARQVEAELQPLRALEQALVEQDRLRVATAERLAVLTAEVDAAAATAAGKTAELQRRLQELRGQLAAAQRFEQAMAAAQAAAAEVLQQLAPPPAAVPQQSPPK